MIVAGFGFRESVTEDSLIDALSRIGDAVKPTHFATVDAKVNNPAFRTFANTAGVKVVAVEAEKLAAQQTITQSKAAFEAYGAGSIAEAVALSAAGPKTKLLAPRVISADRKATCAIATGDNT